MFTISCCWVFGWFNFRMVRKITSFLLLSGAAAFVVFFFIKISLKDFYRKNARKYIWNKDDLDVASPRLFL